MKILKFLICVILLFTLCGCKYGADYVDPEDRYIVTALGFEKNNRGTLVTLETISTIEDSEKPQKIFYGEGKNVEIAVNNAVNSVPANVVLSQCPVILIGDSIKGETIKEIFNFCLSSYEISLSVQVLNCENISKILSTDVGKLSVGHKILKSLNYNENRNQINDSGRLSNVIFNSKNNRSFRLPHLTVKENNFAIDGLSVYRLFVKKHMETLGDEINFG